MLYLQLHIPILYVLFFKRKGERLRILFAVLFQLIISVAFNQAIKLHSLKFKAPSDKGPKIVKIFINQPRTLDFDSADANQPVQELE